jgi:hypothetical protein
MFMDIPTSSPEKYDEHSETPGCLGKTKFHIRPNNTDGKKVEGPDRLGQSRLGDRDCNESGWKGSKEELERRKQGDWLKTSASPIMGSAPDSETYVLELCERTMPKVGAVEPRGNQAVTGRAFEDRCRSC